MEKFKYHHYVYSAGNGPEFPQNDESNEAAIKARQFLLEQWDMNACIHGHYPDVKVTLEVGNNLEIKIEANSVRELCNACIEFTKQYCFFMDK